MNTRYPTDISHPDVSHAEASHPDVFIAGGGPAGLACAIACAQLGLSVEVADGMTPPIDKACGEGLMPDTLAALTHLGIDLDASASSPFAGIRFLAIDHSGRSITTQADFPAAPGRGMRRPILHQLLIDRATALGVRFSWQTIVQRIERLQKSPEQGTERSLVHTNRHTIRPRYIVGADGHQSRVRSWASLNRSSTSAKRMGLRQHYAINSSASNAHDLQTNYVEVHWSDHGQGYVTPISSHELCVAFVARKKFPTVDHALSHFPLLQQRLRHATPTNEPRGSITLSRRLHRVTSGNVALVGDASGSVDAVTGEGLGLAFRQSLALAEAIKANDLSQYQRAHLALQRLPHFMSGTMLLLDRSPFLRNRALTVFERRPQLFRDLLRIHIGHTPLRVFGPTGMLATGAHILAG